MQEACTAITPVIKNNKLLFFMTFKSICLHFKLFNELLLAC
ncbi:hypothetical protein EJP617_28250 [Erwinia sp. Ejp617]|nr:hypothetical protein EJP617_28250 [Erwinia sp. Ejp617]